MDNLNENLIYAVVGEVLAFISNWIYSLLTERIKKPYYHVQSDIPDGDLGAVRIVLAFWNNGKETITSNIVKKTVRLTGSNSIKFT